MHHKFMVVDNFDNNSDPQVLTGSHNWSTAAETKNDENTLIVHDANITNQYFQAFVFLYQLAGGTINSPLFTIENNRNEASLLKIIPNPTNGIFEIVSNEAINDLDVHLYDVIGKLIFEKQFTSLNACSIDLSSERTGFYFMDVNYCGKTEHYKIVKK